MKVSIVIPNYNTWDLVERNISACLKFDDNLIDEIIVVDDCSPTLNPKIFPEKVKIIRNEQNLHYTKTVNVGLKYANGELVILLDSDAYPTEGFITKLIRYYKSNNELGCVGFKTVNNLGNDTGNFINFPSVLSLIVGQQLHARLRHFDFRKNRKIIPFSCAVSFRKKCLQEMDYLDDNFRVLDADLDLSYRIHLSRWKLEYQPAIEIYHVGGGSISKNYKRTLLFYTSRWQLLKKFNLLYFPRLTKTLIINRFWLEKLLLKIFMKKDLSYKEKLKGRKELIKLLQSF